MSQHPLQYAHSTLPRARRSLRDLLPISLFWISVAFLLATATVIILPFFGPFYSGNPLLIIVEMAIFLVFYGKWISTTFALLTIVFGWLFRRAGWSPLMAVCIALAVAACYWLLVPGDGSYRRMMFGAC